MVIPAVELYVRTGVYLTQHAAGRARRMAMAMNLGTSGKRGADINVTPLIDVLLVLLIIFMVLTPFHPMGEKALIPQPPEKTPVPDIVQPRIVVLQMAPDPSGFPALRLNGQATNWSDLQAKLQTIYKDRIEKNIFVHADETLDWDPVAHAIGIAHNAGVVNVGLITTRIEQAGKQLDFVPIDPSLLRTENRECLC